MRATARSFTTTTWCVAEAQPQARTPGRYKNPGAPSHASCQFGAMVLPQEGQAISSALHLHHQSITAESLFQESVTKRVSSPFPHPASMHRAEVLYLVRQSENTGALTVTSLTH